MTRFPVDCKVYRPLGGNLWLVRTNKVSHVSACALMILRQIYHHNVHNHGTRKSGIFKAFIIMFISRLHLDTGRELYVRAHSVCFTSRSRVFSKHGHLADSIEAYKNLKNMLFNACVRTHPCGMPL